MNNQLFIRNIRRLCKERGISISQMETDLGWSTGLISRWSKTCPSFDKVAAIVDYLQVSFDSLLAEGNTSSERTVASQLVECLIEMTREGKVNWKLCAENEDMKAIIDQLANNECLIDPSYYCAYEDGYFILAMAEDEQLPFSPRLYTAVDKYAPLSLESSDKVGLGVILSQVDPELYTSWSDSRRQHMITSFIKKSN